MATDACESTRIAPAVVDVSLLKNARTYPHKKYTDVN